MSLTKTHPSAAKVTDSLRQNKNVNRKLEWKNHHVNSGFLTDTLREFDQNWVSNFCQVSLIYFMPLQFALVERQMSIVVGVISQAS